jgi:hypothetical protein
MYFWDATHGCHIQNTVDIEMARNMLGDTQGEDFDAVLKQFLDSLHQLYVAVWEREDAKK